MTQKQFIDSCKQQGVNVLSVYFKKKAIHVTYTVTLTENTVSQRTTVTSNSLQALYSNKFASAGTWIRF